MCIRDSTTRIRRFFNTNGFKYICIAALVIILLGAVGIHLAEGMSPVSYTHLDVYKRQRRRPNTLTS